MKTRTRRPHRMVWLALGLYYFTACGSLPELSGQKSKDGLSEKEEANAAADEEITSATAVANLSDVVPATRETSNLPAYLQVVQEARDYTRKLLGLSTDPLKEFRAAIEAARALATSREDFEEKIAAARTKFEAAMDAQKATAELGKKEHADELAQIFAATQKVFMDCGDDLDLHKFPKAEGDHEHGQGKGHKHHGKEHGKGPGRKGFGPPDRHLFLAEGTEAAPQPTASAADSEACKTAAAALKTLITQ